MRERIDIRKVATYSIVINSLQIAAVVLMLVLLMTAGAEAISGLTVRGVMIVASFLVCWGAIVDIREARFSLRVQEQREALVSTYAQVEALNQTMRAQRHDFMNHLQVVYSLIEMQEEREALDYIERVHGDMQRVSRVMRTANPAVNALLQAKLADCERRGIKVELTITSQWTDLPIPGWEMCRVLGNLIDNAMDVLLGKEQPRLMIRLYEDVKAYCFTVENNGEPIPPATLASLFRPGFTTKEQGHGMGLFIVREILQQYQGDIAVESDAERTAFCGTVPKTPNTMAESCDD